MGTENRMKALAWWTDKIKYSTAKEILTDKYFKGRHFTTLTGREVEEMWRKETKIFTNDLWD